MTKITTQNALSMRDVYVRLNALGLKRTWLRDNILPEWWQDDLATVASARSELEIYLAQTLGLELSTLRDPNAQLRFAAAPRVRFKSHATSSNEKLCLARALGSRLGTLVATAFRQSPASAITNRLALSSLSAASVRDRILTSGTDWIGLEEILAYCWDIGVPVVHAALPDGYKRCDGMALCPQGRPVILTYCGRKSISWHAFIVAHELGHHVLGHVGTGGEIFDEDIRGDREDQEEDAANSFAVEVLTGLSKDDPNFEYSGCWPNAEALSREVTDFGTANRIHPGVILLNLCHHEPKMRPLAMKALSIIEDETIAQSVYPKFTTKLDQDTWNDDEAAFFEHLTILTKAN